MCAASDMLRKRRALSGTFSSPIACSVASTDACACGVGQTPQMRCANCQQSRGSRSFMKISKPRNCVAVFHASVTLPFSTTHVTRRWPSMRVTGSMTTLRLPPVAAQVAAAPGAGVRRADGGRRRRRRRRDGPVAAVEGVRRRCSQPSALTSLRVLGVVMPSEPARSPPTPTACAPRPTTVAAPERDADRLAPGSCRTCRHLLVERRELVPEPRLGASLARRVVHAPAHVAVPLVDAARART